MFEFIQKFFGRDSALDSKTRAKERLRLVLVHDRADTSPYLLQALKEDLVKVISEYMEIDQSALEVSLTQEDGSVALVANIPILGMKRRQAANH